jgi:DNA mismatch repair protein MutS2
MIENNTLHLLEFEKILSFIGSFANSIPTKQAISLLRPLDSRQSIERQYGQVAEIRRLAQARIPMAISPFEDITPLVETVRPEGAALPSHDLAIFTPFFQVLSSLSRQLAYRTDIPLLKELADPLSGFPHILDRLESTLDFEGNIMDSASPLLYELRGKRRSLTARIRKRLEEIVREPKVAIFLQDDFITQRSGRWVIPVRMDSKGMVAGVVHDVSNTGETAFMEPLEIIGLANELENLAAEIKAEEIRIVRVLCREIRLAADDILREFHVLVRLDILNSIARFADTIEAYAPVISDRMEISLRGARHPLLVLLQDKTGKAGPVPLDLKLGTPPVDECVMVITGPNAGGKTIAVKTVGLLVIMALSGIPIPAEPSSTVPMADSLLVDMGDDQSIESSLSTFSAHVANIAAILGKTGSRSLVLLDELGTGTEPGQGAAIACGLLKELQEKGALVIATTHLTDIIAFVHKREGMTNASMEFDQETLTPLYRLQPGEPGQSHAIEIARRYGMPSSIIQFAERMLGSREADFHALLAEMKDKRQQYDDMVVDLKKREDRLVEREKTLAARLAQAEQAKQEAMGKAFADAREIVAAVRRETREILEEARREKSRETLKKLERVDTDLETKLRELQGDVPLDLKELREGDLVFIRSLGFDAAIVRIDEKQQRLRIKAGQREVEVPATDVSLKKGVRQKETPRSRKPAPETEAAHELKLLGARVDEALPILEAFLNQASKAGLGQVKVIHGTGTGALMRGVRDYLDGHPLVLEFRRGEQLEGGNGVTIVTMR